MKQVETLLGNCREGFCVKMTNRVMNYNIQKIKWLSECSRNLQKFFEKKVIKNLEISGKRVYLCNTFAKRTGLRAGVRRGAKIIENIGKKQV